MRRFYVSIALLAFVIITGLVSELYLDRLEKKLMSHIETAEIAYNSDSDSAAADHLTKANEIWEGNMPYLSIFINSVTLDEISLDFLEAIAAAEAEKSDFNASLYSLKFKLTDLIKTERLNWMSFV
ncbi:MAG: DUF4363 family protein [Ruminococcaceae bacterium]|nr:DUF4363 family protein [Oscillospiraceae bacterium]